MTRQAFALPVALILALSAGSACAEGAPLGAAGQIPAKISFLSTFGEERCPEKNDADEIVVCATAPEGDRYRIPKELRNDADSDSVAGGSWTEAVASLDETARVMRPNSCSVVGTGGFSGCTQAMLRQWFAERRGNRAAN